MLTALSGTFVAVAALAKRRDTCTGWLGTQFPSCLTNHWVRHSAPPPPAGLSFACIEKGRPASWNLAAQFGLRHTRCGFLHATLEVDDSAADEHSTKTADAISGIFSARRRPTLPRNARHQLMSTPAPASEASSPSVSPICSCCAR